MNVMDERIIRWCRSVGFWVTHLGDCHLRVTLGGFGLELNYKLVRAIQWEVEVEYNVPYSIHKVVEGHTWIDRGVGEVLSEVKVLITKAQSNYRSRLVEEAPRSPAKKRVVII